MKSEEGGRGPIGYDAAIAAAMAVQNKRLEDLNAALMLLVAELRAERLAHHEAPDWDPPGNGNDNPKDSHNYHEGGA